MAGSVHITFNPSQPEIEAGKLRRFMLLHIEQQLLTPQFEEKLMNAIADAQADNTETPFTLTIPFKITP